MKNNMILILIILFISIQESCQTTTPGGIPGPISYATNTNNYNLTSAAVIQTTASGQMLSNQASVTFGSNALAGGVVVVIDPETKRQTIEGFGSSFTESSAYVLACLDAPTRLSILNAFFSTNGANYTLARTHIGSCDFTVNGKYSYDDVTNDTNLAFFTIAPDTNGFPAGGDIQDPSYDLLPLIKQAVTINPALKIVASPWTAPVWMKDPMSWTGGSLKTEFYESFASYIKKYIEAYQAYGVSNIWAVTPENEPWGGPSWETMTFGGGGNDNAAKEGDYIVSNLGPKMQAMGVKIFVYDHNMDGALAWANVNINNAGVNSYIAGTAIHWYSTTINVYPDILDAIHALDGTKQILHTEGCIDGISTQSPFMWKNWGYWWTTAFTDWAPGQPGHPTYTAVHRYARDIIVGLNHWYVGWIDWNMVLNKQGLPNWKNNQCAAPVMVDTVTKEVFYTPIYYIMSHFSKYIRPGDQIEKVYQYKTGHADDDFHATAAISQDGHTNSVEVLNTTYNSIDYQIQIGIQNVTVTIPANSMQTVIIPMP
jgi:glucosylceramidase